MRNYQTRLKVKRSLKFSTLDGAASSAMAGFTQNYITPFALALKATTVQIGLLSSFPNFALANPAWGSMMADLVHENIRGRYFSFRGRIYTLTTLVFSLIAGLLLQFFTHNIFIEIG